MIDKNKQVRELELTYKDTIEGTPQSYTKGYVISTINEALAELKKTNPAATGITWNILKY